MAKFKASRAKDGTWNRRTIEFPNRVGEDGKPLLVDVRPLSPMEFAGVRQKARAFCEKNGGPKEPKRGEELYEFGIMLYTVALALTDKDSPPKKPEPFFENEADVFDPDMNDRVIAYLYEHCESLSDECGGYSTSLSTRELADAIKSESLQNDPSFFLQMQPRIRWAFTHAMACLLTNAHLASLVTMLLNSSSEPSATSGPESQPSEPPSEPPSSTPKPESVEGAP